MEGELRERVIALLENPDVAGQYITDSSGEPQIFGCAVCCKEDGEHAEDCELAAVLRELKGEA